MTLQDLVSSLAKQEYDGSTGQDVAVLNLCYFIGSSAKKVKGKQDKSGKGGARKAPANPRKNSAVKKAKNPKNDSQPVAPKSDTANVQELGPSEDVALRLFGKDLDLAQSDHALPPEDDSLFAVFQNQGTLDSFPDAVPHGGGKSVDKSD